MKGWPILVLWLCAASSVAAERPPNVLLVVADDLNCAIGPYGDRIAVTPNLNRLAQRGVVFTKAYCQQAVCNPSRSSFLTGLRPNSVRVDDLRKYFRDTVESGDQLVTLPQHFKNHGYFCQNIGKIFHNMGDTQDRQSWSLDEVLFKGTHAADTVYFNTPPQQREPLARKAPVTEAHEVADLVYRDGQIANLAAAMLRDYPADARPFFLAVGFWRPHLPFVAPRRYWDLYDPAQIPLPEPAVRPEGAPSIALHDSREIRGYGRVPQDRPFEQAEIRHYRHGYYAAISFLDTQLGKILEGLAAGGHVDDTIVVFTSDHGFHIGEQGLWGKTSNFELDARVPLIVADPTRTGGHGQSTPSLAELVDLYPTLASLAQIEAERSAGLEGDDLSAIVDDPNVSIKTAAFTQHQQPFYGPPTNWKAWGYSVRTDKWRYTEWRSIQQGEILARELYDHVKDPGETRNVAELHAAVVASHAALIQQQFSLQVVE